MLLFYFSFTVGYVFRNVLSAKLLTRKEIFIYAYVNSYLHVEKYFFTYK